MDERSAMPGGEARGAEGRRARRRRSRRAPAGLFTRVATGTLLAVVAAVVIARGGLVYFGVTAVIGFAGLNEFYRLMRLYRPVALPGFIALAAMLALAFWYSLAAVLGGLALAVALIAVMGMVLGPKPGVTVRMSVTLLGVLYLGLGVTHLLLLRRLPDGALIVFTVVIGTWAGDTIAYFTGRYFGATPMTPVLSPKKTWEGFVGGLIGTVLFVEFMSLYSSLGAFDSLVLGVVIGVVGPLGDLFESLLKRDVQIKDSGRGLPGHGGILDRFDALIWTSVASYYLLTLAFGV